MKTGRALEKEYADKFAAARKIINVTCRHYKTKKDVIISIVERSYLKAQDKALEQAGDDYVIITYEAVAAMI